MKRQIRQNEETENDGWGALLDGLSGKAAWRSDSGADLPAAAEPVNEELVEREPGQVGQLPQDPAKRRAARPVWPEVRQKGEKGHFCLATGRILSPILKVIDSCGPCPAPASLPGGRDLPHCFPRARVFPADLPGSSRPAAWLSAPQGAAQPDCGVHLPRMSKAEAVVLGFFMEG